MICDVCICSGKRLKTCTSTINSLKFKERNPGVENQVWFWLAIGWPAVQSLGLDGFFLSVVYVICPKVLVVKYLFTL